MTEHGPNEQGTATQSALNEDLLFNAAPGGPPRYSHLSHKPVQYLTVADRHGQVIGYAWANDEDDAAGWVVRKAGGDEAFNEGSSVGQVKLHDAKARALRLPPPWQR